VLYDPGAFAPLTEEPWDEARVRDRIAAIVADADAVFDSDELWPAHEWDGYKAPLPLKNLYVGAAGVVWALDDLRRRGLAETTLDLSAIATTALERWRAEPDFIEGEAVPEPAAAGLLTGEVGILLAACTLGHRLEDDLRSLIRANLANEADDLMWGTPGRWSPRSRWAGTSWRVNRPTPSRRAATPTACGRSGSGARAFGASAPCTD
jgi:hypothetical protein